jgi:hypothetical protein
MTPHKVIWKGPVKVGSLHLECMVYDDGTRTFEPESWRNVMDAEGTDEVDPDTWLDLAYFLSLTGIPRAH